jgi:hypothetical protein
VPLSACLSIEISGESASSRDCEPAAPHTAQIFQLPLPFETTELLRRAPRSRPVCPTGAIALQLRLPLTIPERVPTGLQVEVLRLMVRLGAARSAVPSNPSIGNMIGARCRQSVSKALIALEGMGILRVQYREAERRFYIPRVALITGWGEHRMGFSRRRQAPIFQVKPTPAVVPVVERIPMARGAWEFMGVDSRLWNSLDSLVLAERPVGPAATCQWVQGRSSFCGRPTGGKRSYCQKHAEVVYSK